MKGKFDISGRTATPSQSSPMDDAVDRFVAGVEPMTTMTFQLPVRLQRVLKQAALDRGTTVKALLIELIEGHLVTTKQ
jgi:hypothetical protein